MPITFSQAMMFITGAVFLMISIDWILSKVKKDWKPLPWEEEEARGFRDTSSPTGEG